MQWHDIQLWTTDFFHHHLDLIGCHLPAVLKQCNVAEFRIWDIIAVSLAFFHKAAELRGRGCQVGFQSYKHSIQLAVLGCWVPTLCHVALSSFPDTQDTLGHPWLCQVFLFSSVQSNILEISAIDVSQPMRIKPNLSIWLETTKPTKLNEMQHVTYDVCIYGGWLFKECGSMDEAFWQQCFFYFILFYFPNNKICPHWLLHFCCRHAINILLCNHKIMTFSLK